MVVGASGFSKKWPRDAFLDLSDYIIYLDTTKPLGQKSKQT